MNWVRKHWAIRKLWAPMTSDELMIDYNQKSVGLASWTDDQAQS